MTLRRHSRTVVATDTLVTATVISDERPGDVSPELQRALRWIELVEAECSRFEPGSEVSRLATCAGTPARVGSIVLGAVEVVLAVAEASCGAFDPTVGGAMERRGYDRNYRTGARVRIPVETAPSWRDVILDRDAGTIFLRRALLLDLGATAKGLAVDLALATTNKCGSVRSRARSPSWPTWRSTRSRSCSSACSPRTSCSPACGRPGQEALQPRRSLLAPRLLR